MPKLRPMLAAKAPEDLDELRYPVIASPKLDGVRAIIKDGVVLSRTLKPIRNRHVQRLFGREVYNGFDGELIVGNRSAPNCMQATSSGVMSTVGEPVVKFWLFDLWNRGQQPYREARLALYERWNKANSSALSMLEQYEIRTTSTLEEYEKDVLSDGMEGLILRQPDSPYKFNRSTTKQQWMLKLKRYEQAEAVVVGVEELMRNLNELEEDECGYAKRSSARIGKFGADTLGSLLCIDIDQETKQPIPGAPAFGVGTGFTEDQRQRFWDNQQKVIGSIITYRSFTQQGVLNRPRNLSFVSFRSLEDL